MSNFFNRIAIWNILHKLFHGVKIANSADWNDIFSFQNCHKTKKNDFEKNDFFCRKKDRQKNVWCIIWLWHSNCQHKKDVPFHWIRHKSFIVIFRDRFLCLFFFFKLFQNCRWHFFNKVNENGASVFARFYIEEY